MTRRVVEKLCTKKVCVDFLAPNYRSKSEQLGARLRGRTATQRSKKGSEKVLERVLGKGFSEGFREGGLLWVLQ